MVFNVIEGGLILLNLRGLDFRAANDKSKRIPYWIDYTKFAVNDDVIFEESTPIWHDSPYDYKFEAKAGEQVKISIEWLPHRSDI